MTVVIPTLWSPKARTTLPLSIELLNGSGTVSQIIVINNSCQPLPANVVFPSKVTVISPEANLYVNPSWNLGVGLAGDRHTLLLNDDIVFDPNAISAMETKLYDEDCLIGCGPIVPLEQANRPFDLPVVLQHVPKQSYGYGCAMAFRTSSYVTIPNDILIWYGDTFLERLFVTTGRALYRIMSFAAKGYVETTSHQFPPILHQDHVGWRAVAGRYNY